MGVVDANDVYPQGDTQVSWVKKQNEALCGCYEGLLL